MYRHSLELVLMVFVALSVGASEQPSVLTADSDIWFWEAHPDVTMEDDLVNAQPIFADGFESSDTTAWSSTVPPQF